MSNYTQSTNFATKDALPSGDPLKIVKGTEINTEFNNISVAIATKADLVSPTFTGTPAAPTASAGNNSTQLATTAYADAAIAAAKQALYPVGSIYTNATVSTNPSTLLGFGTWTAFGAGRVMVGFDAGNALFDAAEETGGSADATLPSHTHTATSTSTVTDAGHIHTTLGFGSGNSATYGNGGGVAQVNNSTASAFTGISVATTTTNTSAGTSGTNANYQPYITVYMWKRTA
jgi:hypothetical protein